ncbi:hypothetical protein ThrDRAFT_03158 [Frankia casuarinae]|uniref:hypothetical protein n=1 Tax=Frankia TaxID=1854 RepID=UPI0003CFD5BF|nr:MULTISPECIES: hypothetical protein [Frankia]ETA00821.1 hypothetical protein CcI6DRAFT_03762 [Frankia sp. CcI6]EYT91231.1 hypothetical protein ThrDRAFT_03158 [Frankia casuarinae]KFB03375.1 hypothetical protein ALLO2DRAFT_03879 [Frankia sp. Allo2]OAA21483.1 hypothetical protein AAY23_107622 [Frankia casuarinae]OFB42785.1 hypothetical protein Manayef4_13955 [Frankia sp. CgIM4]
MADIDTQGRARLADLAGAVPLAFAAAHCDRDQQVLAGFWRRSLRAGPLYERYCAALATTDGERRVRERGEEPG